MVVRQLCHTTYSVSSADDDDFINFVINILTVWPHLTRYWTINYYGFKTYDKIGEIIRLKSHLSINKAFWVDQSGIPFPTRVISVIGYTHRTHLIAIRIPRFDYKDSVFFVDMNWLVRLLWFSSTSAPKEDRTFWKKSGTRLIVFHYND